MDTSSLVSALEYEWEDGGFLEQLRQGKFDQAGYERLLSTLTNLRLSDDEEYVHRRVVELLWFIPLFMSWQKERVEEKGGNIALYEEAFHAVLQHIYRILGTP